MRRAVAIAALAAGIAFYAGAGHHLSSPEAMDGAVLVLCFTVFAAVVAVRRVEPPEAGSLPARDDRAARRLTAPVHRQRVAARASPALLQRFLF